MAETLERPSTAFFANYFAEVNRGIATLISLLERPAIARRAVLILLAVHTLMLAYSAHVHSPTLNEPAHLVAGLSHWTRGSFEIYRVNPPLVRMVAALPVMAVGYDSNWDGIYSAPGLRLEDELGARFVRLNGERSFFLFTIARLACIPFSWLGAIVCYLWARDLFGRAIGVIAASMWCFEPNILAHASLMTPDAHASAIGFAACYTFWRWLRTPSWSQAMVTGVILGAAELSKTTLVLLYPLWPLMWFFYRWCDVRSLSAGVVIRQGAMLAIRMVIGIYVLNFGYGFSGSLERLDDFAFVSDLLAGPRDLNDQRGAAADESGNRFHGSVLASLPIPLPKDYVLGIDLQQRDFEQYGHPSYLWGKWRNSGWWYYYIAAAIVKVPLGLLLLPIIFILTIRSSSLRPTRDRRIADLAVLLTPAVVIFITASAKCGFSEHFRYVLPCFPFGFVALSGAFAHILNHRVSGETIDIPVEKGVTCSTLDMGRRITSHSRQRCRSIGLSSIRQLLALCAVLWAFASSVWIYPHSLSYFNELTLGPNYGSTYLLGSNADWGQDLRYLKRWIDTKGASAQTYVSYHGPCHPRDVGLRSVGPVPELGNPVLRGGDEAYCAVSVNLLRGMPATEIDGNGNYVNYGGQYFRHYLQLSEFRRVGYSLMLFESLKVSEKSD